MTIGLRPYCKMIYNIGAILLLFNSTLPAAGHQLAPTSANLAREAYMTQQTQPYDVYEMSPPSGVPGRAYFVNIISHDPSIKKITDKTRIFAPGQINVSDVTVISNNGLSAKITIPDDTPLGRLQFLLK
ncbi:MAG TPA: hypothetical protein VJW17_05310, partial [Pyrinomonadaceae bacterium]|nr:hypothetical protein [Pyrinomonadaceae bacterium]